MSERPRRVLVVGGTGSIGRLVVERLQELGHHVRVVSRNPDKARRLLGDAIDAVSADLTDPPTLTGAVEGVEAIVMTHGAPYGSGDYRAIDYAAVPAVLTALQGRRPHIALMSSIGVTAERHG